MAGYLAVSTARRSKCKGPVDGPGRGDKNEEILSGDTSAGGNRFLLAGKHSQIGSLQFHGFAAAAG